MIIAISLSLSFFVFAFFKTDFVVEYANLLKLGGIFRTRAYEEWKCINDLSYGYPIFIRETFKGFLPRLIGCPYCLLGFISIWGTAFISIVFSLCFGSLFPLFFILYGPVIAGLSSLLFTIQSLLSKLAFEK